MFLLVCICIHVEVLSHEDHSYYLSSFLATFRTSAQNWSFVHQFDMYSWENINAQFVSLKPWDDGLLTRSSVKVKRRMKSSSSLQRNEEFRVGSFTKSIHLFLRFLASGRSSLCKGIACRTISFTTSGNAEHPPATRLPGIFQVRHSETSEK